MQSAHHEQQLLWEAQRTALQDALDVMRDSADANAAAARADMSAAAAAVADSSSPARGPVSSPWGGKIRQQADLVLFLEGKVRVCVRVCACAELTAG